MRKPLLLLFFFAVFVTTRSQSDVCADMAQQMMLRQDGVSCSDYWCIDSTEVGKLYADFDALTFFKDNEWHTASAKGYTLPGARVTLKASFVPLNSVRVEAGIHGVIFNGSNKYPAYVFHDIAQWKGDQYQSGIHPVPWLRAQAQIGKVTVVLGNLYGGTTHRLVEPLYNPEVNITADPEVGVQMLLKLKRYEVDAWVDWQSFIYETDTHQEAFTFGINNRFNLTPRDARLYCYVPLQTVLQHRGGEQNVVKFGGIKTIANVAAGLGVMWRLQHPVVTRVRGEVDALVARQMVGDLWPWRTGCGGYAMVGVDLYERLGLTCSAFGAKRFVPLYGAPFFSTLSTKHENGSYDGVYTLRLGAEYTYPLGRGFSFGIKGESYIQRLGNALSGEAIAAHTSTSFSFGVYLRFTPRFRLL